MMTQPKYDRVTLAAADYDLITDAGRKIVDMHGGASTILAVTGLTRDGARELATYLERRGILADAQRAAAGSWTLTVTWYVRPSAPNAG